MNNLYIAEDIDLEILEDYGFEFWKSNGINWFDTYVKHCEGIEYTNVIVFVDDRTVTVKYDDGFDYNWFRYKELIEVKEVKELIEAELTETLLE